MRTRSGTSRSVRAMSEEDAHFDPLTHVAQPDHPDAEADARARLGRAIRDLGHAVAGHSVPVALLHETAATLEGLTSRFDAAPARIRSEPLAQHARWDPAPQDGAEMYGHDDRPVSGRSSPWGLDLHIVREGDEAVATVTLRAAHEGAPGRSHGGIVAALFDDVSGFVLNILAVPAYTGELTIRYEAGTPIGVPLECRCRLDRVEGRKLFITGELTDAGRVVARTRGLFITINREQFLAGG